MQPFYSDFHVTRTQRLKYLLHLPGAVGAASDRRWLLILFLHGRGESGEELTLVERTGLPQVIATKPEFPFITIAPQCPRNTWWPELADSLDLLLEQVIATYAVDTRRLYLTGLSMGGYGSGYLGTRHPEHFAAIAPICGGGQWFHGFPERVRALREVPVWAFHGARDEVVPLEASEVLVRTSP